MPQYLVSLHRPNDFSPADYDDPAMHRAIDVLNDEMVAAGIRVFVGGLQPIGTAQSLRLQPSGDVTTTPGGYLQANAYVDGFWVLNVADLNEALAWGRKAAVACRADVEVRPFHGR